MPLAGPDQELRHAQNRSNTSIGRTRRICGCPMRRRSRSRAAPPSISPASPPRRSIIIIRIGRRSSTPCRATWRGRRGRRWKISSAGLRRWARAFADVVTADRFVTDLTDQDALNGLGRVFSRCQADDDHGSGRAACHRSALPGRDQCHRGDRLRERRANGANASIEQR